MTSEQIRLMSKLSWGGTWERRNLPYIDDLELRSLVVKKIVQHKGVNGSCEYYALTELGAQTLAAYRSRENADAGCEGYGE